MHATGYVSKAGFVLAFAILWAIAYVRVQDEQLDVVTGLLFLGTVSTLALGLLERAGTVFGQPAAVRVRLCVMLISTLLTVVSLEMHLRFGLNKYSNYY